MYRRTLLFILITAFTISCGGDGGPTGTEPDPEPTTGAIEVITSTNGPDQDSDGYNLSTGGSSKDVAANDTLYLTDLEEDTYSVELSGMASNCDVTGNNPRSISVSAGDTTATSFDVECKEVLKNQIVFISDRTGSRELYVMNDDGSSQERLTTGGGSKTAPAISPDGTRIAYARGSHVYVINADGSDDKALSTGTEGVSNGNTVPSWSPDGSKLAFLSDRDGNLEVYTMNADGTNQVNISRNDSIDYMSTFSWSPDGSKILFSSDRGSGNDFEVYIANTDGTGIIQLTDNTFFDSIASWSPDGSKIAFTSNRDSNISDANGFEIYIMNADGTGVTRLTNNSSYDSGSVWSPDGDEIAFITGRDNNYEIYKMDVDGTGPVVNLSANPAFDVAPFWSLVK
ncbi:DPP IV N-terminal domain-containing protein [Fodinibius sp. AD559]|uniref:DPP IV N-terminal domain-containing protein n=1 Tax=Fodinibius sp. AD559 TaxID=3424179 RepID=UPI004046F8DE